MLVYGVGGNAGRSRAGATAAARMPRSRANPIAQRMQIAWITKISIRVRPTPTPAPRSAKRRSHRSMDHGPRESTPRRPAPARMRRAAKPATPTNAVGMPATAAYGLSRTFEQLKNASMSHHEDDAASYHWYARYPA